MQNWTYQTKYNIEQSEDRKAKHDTDLFSFRVRKIINSGDEMATSPTTPSSSCLVELGFADEVNFLLRQKCVCWQQYNFTRIIRTMRGYKRNC